MFRRHCRIPWFLRAACLLRLALASLAAFLLLLFQACGVGAGSPAVYVLGDMEKPTGLDPVANSPSFYNKRTVTLHGAGNEVLAFQVLLRADRPETGLDARIGDLAGPGTIPAWPNLQIFREYYVKTQDASYSWGPGGGGALPWRDRAWPDALLPLRDPYDPGAPAVAAPFDIDPKVRPMQALWVDVFIPPGQAPGLYHGKLELLRAGRPFKTLPISLTVHSFTLPDQNHVDAYGELYRETGLMLDTGCNFLDDPARAWPVYKRYLQMAHAHRFLATLRAGDGPLPRTPDGRPADRPGDCWDHDLSDWTEAVRPVLDGSLFTAREGYAGPSPGAGPDLFPAPFPVAISGGARMREHLLAHGGGFNPKWLDAYKRNAALLWEEIQRQGWGGVRFFATILDEVDGAQESLETGGAAIGDVAIHRAMRQVQDALDAGAGGRRRIPMLWTSHADAGRWVGTAEDLVGSVSWWVPDGHAVNLGFFQERARRGETVWVCQSGHPAIGNHTINQLGIDLRLWSLLCWRYGLRGTYWWSMMSFAKSPSDPRFNPYDSPSSREQDTRWGNGVLFYPGSRLTMIGCRRNIAGPIPSLRMKAYRRGLQDAEYLWLARQAGRGEDANAILKSLIQSAFSDSAQGFAPGVWSHRVEDYYRFRADLARMIK